MKAIWKYNLKIGHTMLVMPKDAEILSLQVQHNQPCLWALVDTEAEREEVLLTTFGTGHPINEDEISNTKFIGTYQLEDGAFVGHVFKQLNA